MASTNYDISKSEFRSRDEKLMIEYARAKFNSAHPNDMYFGELKVQNNMVIITSGYLFPVVYTFEREKEKQEESEDKKTNSFSSHSKSRCSSDFNESEYDKRGRKGNGWSSEIEGFTNDEVDSYNDREYERTHGRGRYDM